MSHEFPQDVTAEQFNINKSNVSKWKKDEKEIRKHCLYVHSGKGTKKKSDYSVFKSAAARRSFKVMQRGGGKYEAAELELRSEYKKRRANGLKVNARWLKINMKRILSRTCGREVESNFKASNHWVVNFTRSLT